MIDLGLRFKSPIVVNPYDIYWFDVDFPDPGPYEIVFRNRACLICGSDLHVFKGLHPFAPLPACCGHEVAADVVEVGSQVSTLITGDRVYVAGTGISPIACGQCFHCVRGETSKCENQKVPFSFRVNGKIVSRFPSGFGEYTFGHEGKAYKLPKNISYEEAAVTTDLAYVIGVLKRTKAGFGDTITILGAGPIGLRTLQVAIQAGVSKIIVSELVDYRLKCAEELGADILINPRTMDPIVEVMKATNNEGVNFVFDTTGNINATTQGLKMLKSGMGGRGTLILMGLYENPNIQFNISELMFKAGKIVTEWGIREGRNKNIKDALQMMADKKINILKWITHKLPEKKAKEALSMLIKKEDKAIGIEIVH